MEEAVTTPLGILGSLLKSDKAACAGAAAAAAVTATTSASVISNSDDHGNSNSTAAPNVSIADNCSEVAGSRSIDIPDEHLRKLPRQILAELDTLLSPSLRSRRSSSILSQSMNKTSSESAGVSVFLGQISSSPLSPVQRQSSLPSPKRHSCFASEASAASQRTESERDLLSGSPAYLARPASVGFLSIYDWLAPPTTAAALYFGAGKSQEAKSVHSSASSLRAPASPSFSSSSDDNDSNFSDDTVAPLDISDKPPSTAVPENDSSSKLAFNVGRFTAPWSVPSFSYVPSASACSSSSPSASSSPSSSLSSASPSSTGSEAPFIFVKAFKSCPPLLSPSPSEKSDAGSDSISEYLSDANSAAAEISNINSSGMGDKEGNSTGDSSNTRDSSSHSNNRKTGNFERQRPTHLRIDAVVASASRVHTKSLASAPLLNGNNNKVFFASTHSPVTPRRKQAVRNAEDLVRSKAKTPSSTENFVPTSPIAKSSRYHERRVSAPPRCSLEGHFKLSLATLDVKKIDVVVRHDDKMLSPSKRSNRKYCSFTSLVNVISRTSIASSLSPSPSLSPTSVKRRSSYASGSISPSRPLQTGSTDGISTTSPSRTPTAAMRRGSYGSGDRSPSNLVAADLKSSIGDRKSPARIPALSENVQSVIVEADEEGASSFHSEMHSTPSCLSSHTHAAGQNATPTADSIAHSNVARKSATLAAEIENIIDSEDRRAAAAPGIVAIVNQAIIESDQDTNSVFARKMEFSIALSKAFGQQLDLHGEATEEEDDKKAGEEAEGREREEDLIDHDDVPDVAAAVKAGNSRMYPGDHDDEDQAMAEGEDAETEESEEIDQNFSSSDSDEEWAAFDRENFGCIVEPAEWEEIEQQVELELGRKRTAKFVYTPSPFHCDGIEVPSKLEYDRAGEPPPFFTGSSYQRQMARMELNLFKKKEMIVHPDSVQNTLIHNLNGTSASTKGMESSRVCL